MTHRTVAAPGFLSSLRSTGTFMLPLSPPPTRVATGFGSKMGEGWCDVDPQRTRSYFWGTITSVPLSDKNRSRNATVRAGPDYGFEGPRSKTFRGAPLHIQHMRSAHLRVAKILTNSPNPAIS